MPRKPKRVFFSRIGNILSSASRPVKRKSTTVYKTIVEHARIRPLTSFFVLLVLLFVLIFASHTLTKPKEKVESKETPTKEVFVFNLGKSPTVKLQAQVQKSSVVQIVAQAPGIVSKINVVEGKTVAKGTTLVATGNNYQGASVASVQRQLAQTQYANTKDTFSTQKDLINKQRELADKTDTNSDELRDITNKSLDETRSLVSLNENILSSVDSNLTALENTNVNGVNDSVILQTKQLKAQLLAGLNQAKSGLRSAEFASSSDKSPAQLSDLAKDIAKKQLDLQEKSLILGLETARLQLKLAQISESVMFPSAPFAATVERVHVKVGQTVAPGTPLVTLSSHKGATTATALVPLNMVRSINKLENSTIYIGNEKIETNPIYVSKEATNGQLYSVIFILPEGYQDKITDQGFIDIEVPTGYQSTSAAYPFVPLDSVHQTQETAIVFTLENDKAQGKVVTLGEVQGNYVQIINGLSSDDTVILERNVIAGDKIKIKSQQI